MGIAVDNITLLYNNLTADVGMGVALLFYLVNSLNFPTTLVEPASSLTSMKG